MASLKQFLNDKSNKSEVDQYFDDQARFLLEKKKLETIDNFNGYFDFLNNEFPCSVYHDGLIYKTVSHAFQAARSTEQHIREKIVRADTVMEMYEIAANIDDPPDWVKIRLKVMETLVRDKFRRNPELREKLRATETRSLVNTYSDASISNLFWGVVEGQGQNQLGRILESIRNDIHHNIELEKWMFMTFNLEDNKNLQPKLQLDILKGDTQIETIKLEGNSHYFMGKVIGSDVLMTHQSISRRHAALICDSQTGVCLIDLGSKGGSFLNNQKMDSCFPYRLKPGDILHFSASTRRYKISIDYSDVERFLQRKKREVKKQFDKMEALNDPSANPEAIKASLGVIVNDQIFVGGLPENSSYKEVETLLGQFGEVKNVRIPTDRKTGKLKTFAIVTFKDPKECEKAVAADGLKYKERRLKIKWAEKREYDDDRPHGRRDEVDRDRYAKAVRENEDKLGKDVAKRHRRRSRSRSPRDSRRRRDDRRDDRDRDRRDRDRDRHRGNKERDRKKKKSRSRSSSKSSDSESRSKSKSREKERNKKDGKHKGSGKDKETKEKSRKKSESESESKSRSRSKDKEDKKNGTSKKKLTRSQEKEAKNKEAKKKKDKSESESDSGSSSDESGSDSSGDSK